jgi:predicted site-specific integrase-resolvase
MSERINTKEAARLMGISHTTLESWRSRNHKHQPEYFCVNGRIVYDKEEVESFMRNCRVTRRGQ